jgi:hypothetical protein
MVSATQKIWETVENLDQADTHAAALCHAIINMLVQQGVVTREEADRQIEKSIRNVVSVHKRIVTAMQDQNRGPDTRSGKETIQ